MYSQSFDRRKRALKKDKERERWAAIDYQYMIEESDAEGVIYQHKLTWRSEGMFMLTQVQLLVAIYIHPSFMSTAFNRLIRKLDKRLPKRDGDGQFNIC